MNMNDISIFLCVSLFCRKVKTENKIPEDREMATVHYSSVMFTPFFPASSLHPSLTPLFFSSCIHRNIEKEAVEMGRERSACQSSLDLCSLLLPSLISLHAQPESGKTLLSCSESHSLILLALFSRFPSSCVSRLIVVCICDYNCC